ncbi:carbohydrate ABC transporter permease [Kribbella sp. NPDC051952]|uniref:carbohydrate ABC transporter permease n=1 Tax=Kribbella sp. NPDC051952 TaxID=3154851 RepID=UPI0034394D2A
MKMARRLTLLSLAVWSVLPILWVFKMSISDRLDLFSTPPVLVPHHPTASHYAAVLGDSTFRAGVLNSLLIAGTTTLISMTLGSLAAYPLARLRFRGRTLVLIGFLAMAYFPSVAIIAPLFKQLRTAELLDTYVAVIAVDTAFALPLSVWIMVAFFRKLPFELEEAARIDGAGVLQTFRRVILPLAVPGVVTTAILTFVAAWNEFLFANTFLFDQARWPVTVVIPGYAGVHSVDYGAQAAATILVTIPLALVVLVFQRRLVEGLTAGALKS